ncbi:NAD(P)-dependent dehydrogenase, short-chain alcohol dehydrogenase family [Cyclobacterium xiamenense]|uniref:NAD(P)-dependent dehydrogenase, short-chain alcohol dehydrogenase family n=1 Tax=Cyclobacterium xiamenense TaxID=1297121 RepID=A0A1H7BY85_9BACT|nr:SDR family oxidoreductase [Cyclobacterium xiamenense]SEJ82348.1 NAD(P)-dependent dehydrogenase, short-chain alcohol dehydrogenase family [Cyclobacterium xiamenense]
MKLQNKVAAIFAANGAIAREVAIEMAKEGASVYLSGRDLDKVKSLSDEINTGGASAKAYQVDATNESEIENFIQQIIEEEGKLDIVFNGIGIRAEEGGYGKPSTVLSFKTFMKPLETILGSQFLTSRVGAKFMQETESKGTILMLTASLSRLKAPFMAGITAACTGIEGMTRVLASEFGMAGIKVICINPTAMPETRTIQETTQQNAKTMGIPPEVMAEQMPNSSLLKTTLTTNDTAKVATFLVSDAGAALNSHIVDVDFGTASVI